jgi:rubrerythrin
MSNRTDEGLQDAVLISLSDGKSRTEKEIKKLVERICLSSAVELTRRDGLMEVSDNFDWLTEWSVKMKKMKCPHCDFVWGGEKLKTGKCPKCGLDLLKFAEKIFPSLKGK